MEEEELDAIILSDDKQEPLYLRYESMNSCGVKKSIFFIIFVDLIVISLLYFSGKYTQITHNEFTKMKTNTSTRSFSINLTNINRLSSFISFFAKIDDEEALKNSKISIYSQANLYTKGRLVENIDIPTTTYDFSNTKKEFPIFNRSYISFDSLYLKTFIQFQDGVYPSGDIKVYHGETSFTLFSIFIRIISPFAIILLYHFYSQYTGSNFKGFYHQQQYAIALNVFLVTCSDVFLPFQLTRKNYVLNITEKIMNALLFSAVIITMFISSHTEITKWKVLGLASLFLSLIAGHLFGSCDLELPFSTSRIIGYGMVIFIIVAYFYTWKTDNNLEVVMRALNTIPMITYSSLFIIQNTFRPLERNHFLNGVILLGNIMYIEIFSFLCSPSNETPVLTQNSADDLGNRSLVLNDDQ